MSIEESRIWMDAIDIMAKIQPFLDEYEKHKDEIDALTERANQAQREAFEILYNASNLNNRLNNRFLRMRIQSAATSPLFDMSIPFYKDALSLVELCNNSKGAVFIGHDTLKTLDMIGTVDGIERHIERLELGVKDAESKNVYHKAEIQKAITKTSEDEDATPDDAEKQTDWKDAAICATVIIAFAFILYMLINTGLTK